LDCLPIGNDRGAYNLKFGIQAADGNIGAFRAMKTLAFI
jgi:hypothetical protein